MRDILGDLDQGPSDPDPVRRAQIQMRRPLPKRFYTDVAVARGDGGWRVLLDGKPVRTPGRSILELPTERSAWLIADEYAAQGKEIDPSTMPVMRIANTAVDGVARDPQAVADDILRFVGSDLLFYRADAPENLVLRQAQAWDPVLDWARTTLGARFVLAQGVMPVAQPREAIVAVGTHLLARTDPFRLAALHVMTTLMGSALLSLAVEAEALTAPSAWTAAHVDEDWNIETWGSDAEAMARRANRLREFSGAVGLLAAMRS